MIVPSYLRHAVTVALIIPLVDSLTVPTTSAASKTPSLSSPTNDVDHLLDLSMSIGSGEPGCSRMSVRGMIVSMRNEQSHLSDARKQQQQKQQQISSSGLRKLSVIRDGSFVGMTGKQMVSPRSEACCWEILRKNGVPAGSIVCTLNLPESYRRNDAHLPEGELCVSFPIYFSQTELAMARQKKQDRLTKVARHKADLDAAMEQVQLAQNPIAKLLHYRNAALAAEKHQMSNELLQNVKMAPTDDRNILNLGNDWFVMTEGHVWKRNDNFRGSMLLPQTILGTASIAFAAEGE